MRMGSLGFNRIHWLSTSLQKQAACSSISSLAWSSTKTKPSQPEKQSPISSIRIFRTPSLSEVTRMPRKETTRSLKTKLEEAGMVGWCLSLQRMVVAPAPSLPISSTLRSPLNTAFTFSHSSSIDIISAHSTTTVASHLKPTRSRSGFSSSIYSEQLSAQLNNSDSCCGGMKKGKWEEKGQWECGARESTVQVFYYKSDFKHADPLLQQGRQEPRVHTLPGLRQIGWPAVRQRRLLLRLPQRTQRRLHRRGVQTHLLRLPVSRQRGPLHLGDIGGARERTTLLAARQLPAGGGDQRDGGVVRAQLLPLPQGQPQAPQPGHRRGGERGGAREPLHQAQDERTHEGADHRLRAQALPAAGPPQRLHAAQQGQGQSRQRKQLQRGAKGDDQRHRGARPPPQHQQEQAQVIPSPPMAVRSEAELNAYRISNIDGCCDVINRQRSRPSHPPMKELLATLWNFVRKIPHGITKYIQNNQHKNNLPIPHTPLPPQHSLKQKRKRKSFKSFLREEDRQNTTKKSIRRRTNRRKNNLRDHPAAYSNAISDNEACEGDVSRNLGVAIGQSGGVVMDAEYSAFFQDTNGVEISMINEGRNSSDPKDSDSEAELIRLISGDHTMPDRPSTPDPHAQQLTRKFGRINFEDAFKKDKREWWERVVEGRSRPQPRDDSQASQLAASLSHLQVCGQRRCVRAIELIDLSVDSDSPRVFEVALSVRVHD